MFFKEYKNHKHKMCMVVNIYLEHEIIANYIFKRAALVDRAQVVGA